MPKKKYTESGIPWKESICPVCKKRFIPAAEHAYKHAKTKSLVCSYHCRLASEKELKRKHNTLISRDLKK